MRKGLIGIALALGATGCVNSVSVEPGWEAVVVHKPLFFGKGGVDDRTVKTGLEYFWITSHDIHVNMQPQQFIISFNDIMSSDGVPLDFNAVARVKVIDAVSLIKNFGPDWYQNNLHAEVSNRVRQSVRKYGMNETAISSEAIDQIDKEVTLSVQEYVKAINLPVQLIDFTVGKANPPDSVKDQRIETASQQQRQQTEQQRKLAEDQRRMAELSRAAADNAYRESMRLSPDQFLQLESIKAFVDVCGKGGCTIITSGTAVPTYGVK